MDLKDELAWKYFGHVEAGSDVIEMEGTASGRVHATVVSGHSARNAGRFHRDQHDVTLDVGSAVSRNKSLQKNKWFL